MTNSNLVGCSTGRSAGFAPRSSLTSCRAVVSRVSWTRRGPYPRKASLLRHFRPLVHGWQAQRRCALDDHLAIAEEERRRQYVECCGIRCLRRINCGRDLVRLGNPINRKLDPACPRRILQRLELPRRGCVGIGECRHAAKSGHRLDQDFLSLAVELGREEADACCIAAGVGQRTHESRSHHVVGKPEDRNRCRRPLCGANCNISAGHNDIDLALTSSFANSESSSTRGPYTRQSIMRLWPSMKPDCRSHFEHRDDLRCFTWAGVQGAEAIRPAWFLRRSNERPCCRRAAEQRDELAAYR